MPRTTSERTVREEPAREREVWRRSEESNESVDYLLKNQQELKENLRMAKMFLSLMPKITEENAVPACRDLLKDPTHHKMLVDLLQDIYTNRRAIRIQLARIDVILDFIKNKLQDTGALSTLTLAQKLLLRDLANEILAFRDTLSESLELVADGPSATQRKCVDTLLLSQKLVNHLSNLIDILEKMQASMGEE